MTDRPSNIDQSGLNGTAPLTIVRPRGVLAVFSMLAMAGLGGAFGLGHVVDATGDGMAALAALIVFALGAGLTGLGLSHHYSHPVLGLCNSVTILRLVGACALVGALFAPSIASWPVFLIATVAFSLDGLDGYLARREGLNSQFGARFDMEVDSLLALALACLAFKIGAAGAYVLLLGVPRYAFGVAQIAFPWLKAPLPPRFSRKVVCVMQIFALLMMVFPPATSPVTDVLAAVAALALVWSFWVDIRWLRQAHPS